MKKEKPLKSDEKCFLVPLKSFFSFWRFLKFCSDIFGHVGKRLDKKAKVNFKIYHVPNWETINYKILPNISRSKSSQTMKFGQLIRYNMKNIFLRKLYTKCGRD